MEQSTKFSLDSVKRLYHKAGMILKCNSDGFVIQIVGTSAKIHLHTYEAVVAYINGYNDGFFEERLFVKRGMCNDKS